MAKYIVTAFINKKDNEPFYRRDVISLPRDTRKEAEDFRKGKIQELKETTPELRNWSQFRIEKISDRRAKTIK